MPTITERLNASLDGDWAGTLTRFRVVDVPAAADPSRALLICESPHRDEVTDEPMEHRYPLRGATGRTVTEALVDYQEPVALQYGEAGTVPVGQLVQQGRLDSIRIVNVCELPLQAETYAQRISEATISTFPEGLAFSEWCRLVLAFRTVRKLRRNAGEINDPLVDHILEDFRCRLGNPRNPHQVRTGPALVCGLAAQACWCRLGLPRPTDSNHVRFVPHPSWRSRWFDQGQLKDNVRRGLQVLLARPVDG